MLNLFIVFWSKIKRSWIIIIFSLSVRNISRKFIRIKKGKVSIQLTYNHELFLYILIVYNLIVSTYKYMIYILIVFKIIKSFFFYRSLPLFFNILFVIYLELIIVNIFLIYLFVRSMLFTFISLKVNDSYCYLMLTLLSSSKLVLTYDIFVNLNL